MNRLIRWWRLRGTDPRVYRDELPPLDGQRFMGWQRTRGRLVIPSDRPPLGEGLVIAAVNAVVHACKVPDCSTPANQPGSARGYCIRHYARWHKYGVCEALRGCQRPATSHLGLCEAHTPEGIPA